MKRSNNNNNNKTFNNIFKQQTIEKIFSGAKKAAKADLFFNEENEYPEFIIDNESLDISVKAKGAYENSNEILLKLNTEVRKDFINEITTQNLGQPNKKPDQEYFENNEE